MDRIDELTQHDTLIAVWDGDPGISGEPSKLWPRYSVPGWTIQWSHSRGLTFNERRIEFGRGKKRETLTHIGAVSCDGTLICVGRLDQHARVSPEVELIVARGAISIGFERGFDQM